MRLTEQWQGPRMLKLRGVLSRWEAAGLSQLEAAGLLGGAGQRFRQAKPVGMPFTAGVPGAVRAVRSPIPSEMTGVSTDAPRPAGRPPPI